MQQHPAFNPQHAQMLIARGMLNGAAHRGVVGPHPSGSLFRPGGPNMIPPGGGDPHGHLQASRLRGPGPGTVIRQQAPSRLPSYQLANQAQLNGMAISSSSVSSSISSNSSSSPSSSSLSSSSAQGRSQAATSRSHDTIQRIPHIAAQAGNLSEATLGRIDSASVSGKFGWTGIDGVEIPFLLREEKKYLAVRMVEMKLLSKYPSTYPEELKKRPPLMSHYITEYEARLLNEINIHHCNGEYGTQPFVTQHLIVKMSDFEEFYSIVKKHFPANVLAQMPATHGSSAQEKPVDGGWIQLNNTVVPFVYRSKVKYVPLSVVRYAAGLLTDVRVEGNPLKEDEWNYLNEGCRGAGVEFMFAKTAKLVMLDVVQRLCNNSVNVSELPKEDPFSQAQYHGPGEEEREETPVSNAPSSMSLSTNQIPYTANSGAGRGPVNGPSPPSAAATGTQPSPQQGGNIPYWMNHHLGIYPGGNPAPGAYPGSSSHMIRGPGGARPGVPSQGTPHQITPTSTGRSGSSSHISPPANNAITLQPKAASSSSLSSSEVNNNFNSSAQRRPSHEAMDLSRDLVSPRDRKEQGGSATMTPGGGTALGRSLSSSSLSQVTAPRTSSSGSGSGLHRSTPDGSPQAMIPQAPPGGIMPGMGTMHPTLHIGPDGLPVLANVLPPGHPGWHSMMANPAEYHKMVQIMQLQAMAQQHQHQQQQLQQQLQLLEQQHLQQQRFKQHEPVPKASRSSSSKDVSRPSTVQHLPHSRSSSAGSSSQKSLSPSIHHSGASQHNQGHKVHSTPPPPGPPTSNNSTSSVPAATSSSSSSSSSSSKSSHNQAVIQRVEFQGKTLSCIVKGEEKEHYALVEALSRVYFPSCTLEEFQFALENVLQVPLVQLTHEEERSFISFYNIPTKTLMCNKVIRLAEFQQHIPQLRYMFKDKLPANAAEKTADPGAPRGTVLVDAKSDSAKQQQQEARRKESSSPSITEALGKKVSAALKAVMGKRPASTDGDSHDSGDSPGPAKQARASLEEAVNRLKQFQAEQKSKRKSTRPERMTGSQSPTSDTPTEYEARSPEPEKAKSDDRNTSEATMSNIPSTESRAGASLPQSVIVEIAPVRSEEDMDTSETTQGISEGFGRSQPIVIAPTTEEVHVPPMTDIVSAVNETVNNITDTVSALNDAVGQVTAIDTLSPPSTLLGDNLTGGDESHLVAPVQEEDVSKTNLEENNSCVKDTEHISDSSCITDELATSKVDIPTPDPSTSVGEDENNDIILDSTSSTELISSNETASDKKQVNESHPETPALGSATVCSENDTDDISLPMDFSNNAISSDTNNEINIETKDTDQSQSEISNESPSVQTIVTPNNSSEEEEPLASAIADETTSKTCEENEGQLWITTQPETAPDDLLLEGTSIKSSEAPPASASMNDDGSLDLSRKVGVPEHGEREVEEGHQKDDGNDESIECVTSEPGSVVLDFSHTARNIAGISDEPVSENEGNILEQASQPEDDKVMQLDSAMAHEKCTESENRESDPEELNLDSALLPQDSAVDIRTDETQEEKIIEKIHEQENVQHEEFSNKTDEGLPASDNESQVNPETISEINTQTLPVLEPASEKHRTPTDCEVSDGETGPVSPTENPVTNENELEEGSANDLSQNNSDHSSENDGVVGGVVESNPIPITILPPVVSQESDPALRPEEVCNDKDGVASSDTTEAVSEVTSGDRDAKPQEETTPEKVSEDESAAHLQINDTNCRIDEGGLDLSAKQSDQSDADGVKNETLSNKMEIDTCDGSGEPSDPTEQGECAAKGEGKLEEKMDVDLNCHFIGENEREKDPATENEEGGKREQEEEEEEEVVEEGLCSTSAVAAAVPVVIDCNDKAEDLPETEAPTLDSEKNESNNLIIENVTSPKSPESSPNSPENTDVELVSGEDKAEGQEEADSEDHYEDIEMTDVSQSETSKSLVGSEPSLVVVERDLEESGLRAGDMAVSSLDAPIPFPVSLVSNISQEITSVVPFSAETTPFTVTPVSVTPLAVTPVQVTPVSVIENSASSLNVESDSSDIDQSPMETEEVNEPESPHLVEHKKSEALVESNPLSSDTEPDPDTCTAPVSSDEEGTGLIIIPPSSPQVLESPAPADQVNSQMSVQSGSQPISTFVASPPSDLIKDRDPIETAALTSEATPSSTTTTDHLNAPPDIIGLFPGLDDEDDEEEEDLSFNVDEKLTSEDDQNSSIINPPASEDTEMVSAETNKDTSVDVPTDTREEEEEEVGEKMEVNIQDPSDIGPESEDGICPIMKDSVVNTPQETGEAPPSEVEASEGHAPSETDHSAPDPQQGGDIPACDVTSQGDQLDPNQSHATKIEDAISVQGKENESDTSEVPVASSGTQPTVNASPASPLTSSHTQEEKAEEEETSGGVSETPLVSALSKEASENVERAREVVGSSCDSENNEEAGGACPETESVPVVPDSTQDFDSTSIPINTELPKETTSNIESNATNILPKGDETPTL